MKTEKKKSGDFIFQEFLQNLDCLDNFKIFLSSQKKFEEELLCYEAIEAYKKIETDEERFEKFHLIFAQFLNSGISFYEISVSGEILRKIKIEKEKITKKNCKKEDFNELENYVIKKLEEKIFPEYCDSKLFSKFFKKFSKNQYKELIKILKLKDEFNQNKFIEKSCSESEKDSKKNSETNDSSDLSENSKSEKKKDYFVDLNEDSENLEIIGTRKIAKDGKKYVDDSNPHFSYEDYDLVFNDYNKLEGWNLLFKEPDNSVYMEKDYSYIEDPKRKCYRVKYVGLLDYKIEDVVNFFCDENYAKVWDPGVQEMTGPVLLVKNKNFCSSIVYGKYSIGWPRDDRSFCVTATCFCDEKKEKYCLYLRKCLCSKVPIYPNTIRSSGDAFYVFEKIEENKTRYFYTVNVDLKGWLPSKFYAEMLKARSGIHKNITKMIQERILMGLKKPEKNLGFMDCLEYFLKQKEKNEKK